MATVIFERLRRYGFQPAKPATKTARSHSWLIHALLMMGLFIAICSWMHLFNFSRVTWYDDELLFAQIARAYSHLSIAEIVHKSATATGEVYSPSLMIIQTFAWKLFGDNSEAPKLIAACLLFVVSLLLYVFLAIANFRPVFRLAVSLLFLSSPLLIECYTWTIAIQHIVTVGLCVGLLIPIVRTAQALRWRNWGAVIPFLILADVLAYVTGFAREPAAVFGATLIAFAPLYLDRPWTGSAVAVSPALFIFPQQVYAFVQWKNGGEVMSIFDHGWIYYTPLESEIRNFGANSVGIYLALVAIQIMLLGLAWLNKSKLSPQPERRGLARGFAATLAVLAVFGANRLGIAFLATMPGTSGLLDFHVIERWVSISAPALISASAILAFAAWGIWRRTKAIIFAALIATAVALEIFFRSNKFDPDIYGPSWIYSRYAIYLLPVVTIAVCAAASDLHVRFDRLIACGVAAAIVIGTAQLMALSAQRAAFLTKLCFQPQTAQSHCPDLALHVSFYNYVLKGLGIAPIGSDLLVEDAATSWLHRKQAAE